jgi:hypothetical protein
VVYFNVYYLEGADQFLATLDQKTYKKVSNTINSARQTLDPEIFKKLRDGIWEFRVHFAKRQIRLLAFWDKTNRENTLVVATHGFIKKVDKVPNKEIRRALQFRQKYFESK